MDRAWQEISSFRIRTFIISRQRAEVLVVGAHSVQRTKAWRQKITFMLFTREPIDILLGTLVKYARRPNYEVKMSGDIDLVRIIESKHWPRHPEQETHLRGRQHQQQASFRALNWQPGDKVSFQIYRPFLVSPLLWSGLGGDTAVTGPSLQLRKHKCQGPDTSQSQPGTIRK